MKMKHLILLLLLALITMVGCLSPDMKDIDPIVDETTPPDREGEEEGFVLLPDPFGVTDNRSGEARSINLLVPGATQSIEWKLNDEFRLANIYLYNKGTLYKTIAENIDNVGKYVWKSEEALEMAHNYEVIVSQHNGTPDENPYLTGYKSSEFSMYPSAVRNALLLVDSLHSDGTKDEKEAFLVAYFKVFQEQGIQFMEDGGRGEYEEPEEIDPTWVNNPIKKMIYEWAQECANDDDLQEFLFKLAYYNLYNQEMRDFIAQLLIKFFGFQGTQDEDGNWHLTRPKYDSEGNPLTDEYGNLLQETIDIIGSDSGYYGFDNVEIIWTMASGTQIKITWTVNGVFYHNGYLEVSVYKRFYTDGELQTEHHELWYVQNGNWYLEDLH